MQETNVKQSLNAGSAPSLVERGLRSTSDYRVQWGGDSVIHETQIRG